MAGLFGVLHWSSLANLIKSIENRIKLILHGCPKVRNIMFALFFLETQKCV